MYFLSGHRTFTACKLVGLLIYTIDDAVPCCERWTHNGRRKTERSRTRTARGGSDLDVGRRVDSREYVIANRSYHFVIAVWRAKEAKSKYDHRPVALRIELVHKVDDHLILMRLMIRE